MKLLSFVLIFSLFSFALQAQELQHDDSFGNLGVVTNRYPDSTLGIAFKASLLPGNEGYLVADVLLTDQGSNNDAYTLTKYQMDGQIDRDFATNGQYIFNFDIEYILEYTLLTNGNIIVLELIDDGYIALISLDKNGNLIERTQIPVSNNNYEPINMLSFNDNVFIGGNYRASTGQDRDSVFLLKLNPNLLIDSSFGKNGFLLIGDGDFDLSFKALGHQNDNLLISYDYPEDNTFQSVISRLTPKGRIDKSFGTSGITSLDPLNMEYGTIKTDDTGDIYIIPIGDLTALKLKSNGVIDSSYGRNGFIIVDSLEQFPDLLTLFSQVVNRSIYFFGLLDSTPSAITPAIIKLRPDGVVDKTFAEGGVFLDTTLQFSEFYGGIVDDKNRILALGAKIDTNISYELGPQSLLVRYLMKPLVTRSPRRDETPKFYVNPNPCFNGQISLHTENTVKGNIIISLTNLQGNQSYPLYSGKIPSGRTGLPLHIPEALPSGIYLLHIRTNTGLRLKKLEIIRRD